MRSSFRNTDASIRKAVVVVDIELVEINDRDVKVLSDFDQLDEMIRGLAESAE